MKIFNGFKARVFLVLLFVFLVFLYIIGHLFYVQIVKGNEWKETGERQYKSEHVIKSKRGKIITNDEEILAYDGESYSITLDPTLVILENIDNLMGLLKKHIPEFNSEKVKKEILEKRKQNKKYMKIENIIDYKTKKLISDVCDMDTGKVLETYTEDQFGICEVYYNDKGDITFTSENFIEPYGETLEDLKANFDDMKKAFELPVLDLDNIVYVEY